MRPSLIRSSLAYATFSGIVVAVLSLLLLRDVNFHVIFLLSFAIAVFVFSLRILLRTHSTKLSILTGAALGTSFGVIGAMGSNLDLFDTAIGATLLGALMGLVIGLARTVFAKIRSRNWSK